MSIPTDLCQQKANQILANPPKWAQTCCIALIYSALSKGDDRHGALLGPVRHGPLLRAQRRRRLHLMGEEDAPDPGNAFAIHFSVRSCAD